MASYPSSIWAGNTRGTNLSDAETHTTWHDDVMDEVVALQVELGTAPSSSYATVKLRLDALATASAQFDTAATNWSSPIAGGITIGNGTLTAQYAAIGPITVCYFRFILGSTSAISGDVQLTLPVIAAFNRINGTAHFDDNSPAAIYPGLLFSTTTNLVALRPVNTSATYATTSACSATVPFTWTTGDAVVGTVWYIG